MTAAMSDAARNSTIPPAALALGLGGLIPFAIGAFGVWTGWRSPAWPPPSVALQAYGAVILSFLGGIRWGLALGEADRNRQAVALSVSVLPSLVAWAALLLPPSTGLPVLAGLVAAAGLADMRIARMGAPDWFPKLRALLSAGAVAALLAASIGAGASP
jgi:hypothetical protein